MTKDKVTAAAVQASEFWRRIPNLSVAHRKALDRIRRDKELVVSFADKNLGLVADSAANYLRHGERVLAESHMAVEDGAIGTASNILLITMDAMRSALTPLLPELLDWMAVWISTLLSTATHPRARKKFLVPAFRLLYKIHKKKLGFRGITGNFCWATQPLAELVAYICHDAVVNYVRDTDHFQSVYRTCEFSRSISMSA